MIRHHSNDDKAVAGVIGFILVFAGIVTYAAYVAHSEVPKWGAQNEAAYDAQVSDAMTHMTSAAAAGLGSQASTTTAIPPPPGAPSVNIPLIDRTEGAPPSASVSLLPDCARLDASHVATGGSTVRDIIGGATGCVALNEQGTYAGSFAYRAEFGGLVRAENGKSYVVAGPTLALKNVSGVYLVGVTFLDVQGAANSVGVGRSGTSLDLVPGPSTTETSDIGNAQSLVWQFQTPGPADAKAWTDWYNGQLGAAGFSAPGCTNSATQSGSIVNVQIDGPNCTTNAPDIALSISYGRYDATLR